MAAVLSPLEMQVSHFVTKDHTSQDPGINHVPMSDVIRLARHAHHYLAIFDKGKALALYHTKRLASAGQRIVLYVNECSDYALVVNP
jgi:hypothetical protein